MILLPNLITALNLILGLAAFCLALGGQAWIACWLIIVCAGLDGLDGRIAQWLDRESRFGMFFDAGADLVSFGAAPAALFYASERIRAPHWAAGLGLLYFFSAAFRLTRFLVLSRQGNFVGLPTTAAAGFYASATLLSAGRAGLQGLTPLILPILSALMVSTLPFPNFRGPVRSCGVLPGGGRSGAVLKQDPTASLNKTAI